MLFQGFKKAWTYRAPKTSIRYTKKSAPKINSDVCFTNILSMIVKNYFIYRNQKVYLKKVVAYTYWFEKKNRAFMFESIYIFKSTKDLFMNRLALISSSFVPSAPFLYFPKASENCKSFWCFQGVEKGYNGNKWVKQVQFRVYSRHI